MKKTKRIIIPIAMALLAIVGLSGCGNNQPKKKIKTKPLTAKNIKGGKGGYFKAIHSTQQLQSTLDKKGNKPKELLLTTSINGQTNGMIQTKLQQQHNKLENELSVAKQKPKLQVSNQVNQNRQQKIKQAKQKQQQQWKKQQQKQKKINQEIKQQQQQSNSKLNQETHPINVRVPSNTTIVSSPNVKTQNVSFDLTGKNIILRNMYIQVPNYPHSPQNQVAVHMHYVNGVKLQHDDFIGVDQVQNKKNNAKKYNQQPTVKGVALDQLASHHIYSVDDRFSSLALGVNQSKSVNELSQLHLSEAQFQSVQLPLQLTESHTDISDINVQYNKGLSLFNINNPEKLSTKDINVSVKGESADNVSKQLLQMAKNTAPTYFINKHIEINGRGYQFLSKNNQLIIKAVKSAKNPPLDNNLGASLSRTDAIRQS